MPAIVYILLMLACIIIFALATCTNAFGNQDEVAADLSLVALTCISLICLVDGILESGLWLQSSY